MLQEGFIFNGTGAGFTTDQKFTVVLGGQYLFAASATFGGGSIALQTLGPDGSTYLDLYGQYDASAAEQNEPINTLTANGVLALTLTPGAYRIHVATATACFASVVRAPRA